MAASSPTGTVIERAIRCPRKASKEMPNAVRPASQNPPRRVALRTSDRSLSTATARV